MGPVSLPTRPKSLNDIVSKKHHPKSQKWGGKVEVSLYYTDTKAQVQVIWGQSNGTNDGFVNDLVLATNDSSNPMRQMGLIHESSRRFSKEENTEVLNAKNSFASKYFCRYIPEEIMEKNYVELLHDRMTGFLTKIAEYLNEQEKKKAPNRVEQAILRGEPSPKNKGVWNHFIVAENSNQTPAMETKAMDHYLLDKDIVALIQLLFDVDNDAWSQWGLDNPIIAQTYFSEPHSNTAKTVLGFPESFIENMEEDDETVEI